MLSKVPQSTAGEREKIESCRNHPASPFATVTGSTTVCLDHATSLDGNQYLNRRFPDASAGRMRSSLSDQYKSTRSRAQQSAPIGDFWCPTFEGAGAAFSGRYLLPYHSEAVLSNAVLADDRNHTGDRWYPTAAASRRCTEPGPRCARCHPQRKSCRPQKRLIQLSSSSARFSSIAFASCSRVTAGFNPNAI